MAAALCAASDRLPVRHWDLPTHSRIAYLKYPVLGERRVHPIVFLHGGPELLLRATLQSFRSESIA